MFVDSIAGDFLNGNIIFSSFALDSFFLLMVAVKCSWGGLRKF